MHYLVVVRKNAVDQIGKSEETIYINFGILIKYIRIYAMTIASSIPEDYIY